MPREGCFWSLSDLLFSDLLFICTFIRISRTVSFLDEGRAGLCASDDGRLAEDLRRAGFAFSACWPNIVFSFFGKRAIALHIFGYVGV